MVELKKVLKKLEAETKLTPNHETLIADLEEREIILPTKIGIYPFLNMP